MTNRIVTWGDRQKIAWKIFQANTKNKWKACLKAEKKLWTEYMQTGEVESRPAYLDGRDEIRKDYRCFHKEEAKVYENAIL